ncbi:MAG: hypothetical protein SGJ18_02655 [Pseudomonadota bacterium]|nr:hypothetical protein [Pseudomonadota bacterium]
MSFRRFYIHNQLFYFILCSLSLAAHAELFKSSYLSFELPSKWQCTLEGTEHVCTSTTQSGKKEAVIVLTAKERGPSDSLAAYEQHLKTPRTIPDDKGKPVQSKIVQVKRSSVNNHEWVDGFHEGSEVANYFTRYMATIKDNLGILVTFSAHKKVYSKFSGDFAKAIQSLRVLSVPSINFNATNITTTNNPINPQRQVVVDDIDPSDPEPIAESSDNSTTLLGLILLILAVVIYFLFGKKSKPRR